VPPDEALYHSYGPPGAVAVSVALFPIQIDALAAVGAGGLFVMETATAARALVQPETVVCR